jgi:hypothetical protein
LVALMKTKNDVIQVIGLLEKNDGTQEDGGVG